MMRIKLSIILLFFCLRLAGQGITFSPNVNCCNTKNIPVEEQKLIVGHASGYQSTDATIQGRNATITRTDIGRYTVTFLTPHPDGAEYEVLFGVEEDANRDITKASVVEGTRSSTGFDMTLTVDDNGAGPDIYNDEPWSFEVLKYVEFSSVKTD